VAGILLEGIRRAGGEHSGAGELPDARQEPPWHGGFGVAERGSAHLCTLCSKCWGRPSGHRRTLPEVHLGRAVLGSTGPPRPASRLAQALSTLPDRPEATSAMLSLILRGCALHGPPARPGRARHRSSGPLPRTSRPKLGERPSLGNLALPRLPRIARSSPGSQQVLGEQGGSR
jgi:hypothetical protein